MAVFAKFVMRDSGRPMFVNAAFVEQVRDTDEPGLTAVYLSGRGTPVVVEEKLEMVMKQLAGAPAPLKLVSSEPAPKAEIAAPPAMAEPVVLEAKPVPAPPRKVAVKAKPAAAKAKSVPAPKPLTAKPASDTWAPRF
jgi:uncharacterized protein YlzI (FlbEa/FlbD family)